MFRPFRIFVLVIGALLVSLGVIAVLGIFFGAAILPFHYFFFGQLLGIFFVLLILFFGLRLLLWPFMFRARGRAWRNYDPAMVTIRQRYARGEISKEQFEQMSHDLDQHRWQQRD